MKYKKVTDKAISFLPPRILPWISEGKGERRFEAVVAFADVSGFTKMSEQLATIGREGAETLTAILNSYFTEMINPINSNGGFVGKFGGDAMTIFFPVEETEKSRAVALRAVSICLDLQKKMVDFQDVKTKAGNFSLGMKIGIAIGNVLFRVVGPDIEGGKEYLLAGIPLDLAAEAEHHGKAGQVIVSSQVALLCNLEENSAGDGFFLVDPSTKLKTPLYKRQIEIEDPSKLAQLAKMFIDPPVYRRMSLGMDSVGEIRRVSVIFMSFSGLDYDLDPEVGDKLAELYAWVHNLIMKFGGSINKVDMGDKGSKMIITFGTPTAHENDEELAVHCGWQLTNNIERVEKLGVVMRMGIASGVVFAGEVGAPSRQEYTVMGSVVNLSARIMAHSSPGRLIVDEATRTRSKDVFEFSEPEYVQFKGIKEPLPVYTVVGLSTIKKEPTNRKREKLIGREKELEIINQELNKVIEKNLRVLILRGDAGIGKSRLVQEIIDLIQNKGFTVGAGEALSYAKTKPYLTWISILRRLMKLPSAGGGEKALRTISEIIAKTDPKNEFRLPIVAGILGIECPDNELTRYFDAQLRQENLFDFIVRFLKYLCNASPVLLIFEDEQWIDRYSLNLVVHLLRNLSAFPLAILFVRRAYDHRFQTPHINQIENSEVSRLIILHEFDRSETEQFVLQKYDAKAIDQELLDFIFDSSDGNPSFTEQMVENLKSTNVIRLIPRAINEGEPEVRYIEKIGDLRQVDVPDSLTSLIMSQLDRLNEEAKLTVKLAAVIGRQFSAEIVKDTYPVEMTNDKINESIAELKKCEIVTSDQDVDLYNYIFKNLLTLDVAYDSLLFAHRREYHNRIGSCLEIMQKDSLTEWYEELARHFSHSDDDSKAIDYLHKAGDKSYALYANESAGTYYSKALERASAENFPRERLNLLYMRSKVYSITGQVDNQKSDLDEMLHLTDVLSDMTYKIITMKDLCNFYKQSNNLVEMENVINAANRILDEIDYPIGKIDITNNTGELNFGKGEFDKALQNWVESADLAKIQNDQPRLSASLTNCGLAYKALGDFDKALVYYHQSMEIDQKLGNKKSEAVNLGLIGVLYHQRGLFDKALESYDNALEIARKIGSMQLQLRNLFNIAVLYHIKGERDRALTSYQESFNLARSLGNAYMQSLSLQNIGAWYFDFGDFEKANEYYNQALDVIRKYDIRGLEPQVMLNLGLTLHYQRNLELAQENLQKAVDKSLELNNKMAEIYARRYLGFVLLDRNRVKSAESQFNYVREIATTIGSQAFLASAEIGIGLVNIRHNRSRKLIELGIENAIKFGDHEFVIRGKVEYAKIMLKKKKSESKILGLLASALKFAESSGYKCDVEVIKPLISVIKNTNNKNTENRI